MRRTGRKPAGVRGDLQYILKGSTDRPGIERLMALIANDLGFPLYRAIATAKHELSRSPSARVAMDRAGVAIDEELPRVDFEAMIHQDIDAIVATAEQTMAAAGLSASEVDVCFLTGGCSLVPAVGARFRTMFADRVSTEGDAFTSVAAGLALYGLEA